jgi:hypothetical protein
LRVLLVTTSPVGVAKAADHTLYLMAQLLVVNPREMDWLLVVNLGQLLILIFLGRLNQGEM